MVTAQHDLLLAVHVLLLLGLHDVVFLQTLERQRLARLGGALNQLDPAEAADAQRGDDVQTVQS